MLVFYVILDSIIAGLARRLKAVHAICNRFDFLWWLEDFPDEKSTDKAVEFQKNYSKQVSTEIDILRLKRVIDVNFKAKKDGDMINVMSENTYRDVFNYDFNIEFFKRMKDRCDVCAAYQNLGDEKDARTEADYKEHIALKESSRIFKDNVKTRLKDEPTLAAAVFDL